MKKVNNKENPFLQYGVAIENFFNLEVQMIYIFFILTLLTLPQMGIFAAYNSNGNYMSSSFLDSLTFSSLGQANTVCSKSPNFDGQNTIDYSF